MPPYLGPTAGAPTSRPRARSDPAGRTQTAAKAPLAPHECLQNTAKREPNRHHIWRQFPNTNRTGLAITNLCSVHVQEGRNLINASSSARQLVETPLKSSCSLPSHLFVVLATVVKIWTIWAHRHLQQVRQQEAHRRSSYEVPEFELAWNRRTFRTIADSALLCLAFPAHYSISVRSTLSPIPTAEIAQRGEIRLSTKVLSSAGPSCLTTPAACAARYAA